MQIKKFKNFEIIFLTPAKTEGVKFYNENIERSKNVLRLKQSKIKPEIVKRKGGA